MNQPQLNYDPVHARSVRDVWRYWASQKGNYAAAMEFDWIPDAMTRSGIVPAETESAHEFYICFFLVLGQFWEEQSQDRNATATKFLDYLGKSNLVRGILTPPPPDVASEASREAFARECQDVGIDFDRGLEQLATVEAFDLPFIVANLFELGVIDPGRWLRPECFESLGAGADRTDRLVDGSDEGAVPQANVLESPKFWFDAHPGAIGTVLLPALRSTDAERVAGLTRGAIVAGANPWASTESIIELRTALLKSMSDELNGRLAEHPHMSPEPLRHALVDVWSQLIWKVIRDEGKPSDKVVAIAQYELACWRKQFESASDSDTVRHFASERMNFETCVAILFTAKPLWDAIRPLILALRALNTPAVASDLRYWNARVWPTKDELKRARRAQKGDPGYISPYGSPSPEKPDPPMPWNAIPETTVTWFHSEAAREQDGDADLEDLRHRFARFCLDRLKFDKRLGRLVEPDPTWRIGFVRAAAELRANPRGKGHRTLYNVVQAESEDATVREAASMAYEQMLSPSGLGTMSPRTTFIRAYGCLLQAHLETLGISVEKKAAQATMDAMVRRTAKKIEEVNREDLWS